MYCKLLSYNMVCHVVRNTCCVVQNYRSIEIIIYHPNRTAFYSQHKHIIRTSHVEQEGKGQNTADRLI